MKKVIQMMKRSMLLLSALFLFMASGHVAVAETAGSVDETGTEINAADSQVTFYIYVYSKSVQGKKNWEKNDFYKVGKGKGTVYYEEKMPIHIAVSLGTKFHTLNEKKIVFTIERLDSIDDAIICEVPIENFLMWDDDNYHFIYNNMPPAETTIFEAAYKITNLTYVETDSNGVETVYGGNVNDEVVFVYDNRSPQIEFTYPKEDSDSIYLSKPFQGEVRISDLNLKADTISINNKEGYETAEITLQPSEEKDTQKNTRQEVVYKYGISEEGEYCLSAEAEDSLGYRGGQCSKVMVLDTTAPDVSVSVARENGTKVNSLEGKYFKENVTVTVQVSDAYLDVDNLCLTITGRDSSGQTVFIEKKGEGQEAWNRLKDRENGFSCTYTFSEEGQYSFQISAKDLAGNGREMLSFENQIFYIDKTNPIVTINYDDTEAKNEIYYRDARTATITVQDFTFQEDGVEFLITSEEGHSPVYGQWVHHKGGNCDGKQHTASCRYTMEVTFDKDDIYDVAVRCKDKAGNSSERVDGGHFVIDRTAPVILITYDQNKEDDGYFYNVTRTASIVITDLSFDKNSVVIGSAQWGYDDITQTGNWTDVGKRHTLPVVFDKDGNYQFTVTATDLAGNQAEVQTSEYFVIDKTAPTLTIQGVGDLLAYSEEVKPEIIYGDIYLDDSQTKINISGAKSGEAKIKYDKYPMRNGFSIMYRDFAYSEDWDDLYVLTVSVQDMAGNVSEQSVMFSVNRYGSVYVPGEETRQMLDNYYIDGKTDLVISEINVDYLTATEITSSFNGEIKTLEAGRDYLVTAEGTEETWKTYRYVINSSNFEEDGYYVLTLSSKDKAENASDNRIKGTELRFAVDRTAPNMVVTGARNNDENSQDSMKMTVDVQDNMSMDSLSIYENDQLLWEFDRETLQEKGGVVSFAVKEADETMPIRVCARDTAGNVREKRYASAADSIGGVDALMKNPVFIAALGLVVLMLIAGGLYGREVFVNKSKDKG